MGKRVYNKLEGLFQDFLNRGVAMMQVDHSAMGYKDARSAHRSLHYALKDGLHFIGVKWNQGVVYLVRKHHK